MRNDFARAFLGGLLVLAVWSGEASALAQGGRAPATMITPARYQRLREEFDRIMLQLRAAERDADGLCQLRALQLRAGALRALERAARDYARTAPEGGQPSAAELNQIADRAREAADYYERALLQDCTERSLADEAEALNSRHESAARECDPEAMAALLDEIEEVEQQAERIQRIGRLISAEAARAQLRRVRAILAEARAREAQNCPTEDSAASPTGAPEGPVTADEAAQADAAEPSPSASAFDFDLPPIGEPPAELCINYNFDEDVDCGLDIDFEVRGAPTQPPSLEDDEDPEAGEVRVPTSEDAGNPEGGQVRAPPAGSPDRQLNENVETMAPLDGQQPPGAEGSEDAPDLENIERVDDDCITYNFDQDIDCEPTFLEFGIGETEMPVTGIGFRRDGAPGAAPETFAVTTPRSTDIVFIGGGIRLPFGRIAPIVTFGYAEGDARRDFAIPAGGGVDSGVVYGALSPSGSSGIATPFGLSGGAAFDQTAIDVGVEVPIFTRGDRSGRPRISTVNVNRRPFLVVTAQGTFQRSDTDYQGDAAFSGSGLSFSQTRSQEVDETRIGAGLGATFLLPLADDVAVRLSASGLVYHRDTELTSSERNLCSFCPAADRDFRIDIDESDKGWGFQADVEAVIEFWLSPRFALTFGGRADYLSSVGGVFNPNSGDQVFFDGRRTGLLTDSIWSWRVGAGVRIAFDGR